MIVAGFDISESRFFPYYYKIWKRQIVWRKKLAGLANAADPEKQLLTANSLAVSAVYSSNGYWSCRKLEQVYLNLAAKIPDVKCCPKSNTFLHVLTKCYCTGGHSRVVERWINNSPTNEIHSVILLNQEDEDVPHWLQNAVENHNGSFIILDVQNQMDRAAKLREIASQYSRIVLHVHMEDGTPIIAFGVNSFTNPVIFFNHADHLFWLGVSIADIVADIRHNTKSIEYRKVMNSIFIGIPQENTVPAKKRDEYASNAIRKELSLGDSFVVVTTANESKLRPIENIDFVQILLPLIKDTNIKILVIGVRADSEYWRDAYRTSGEKIIAMGEIRDKMKYESILQISDLYLGSVPFASFTAMIDAVKYGVPFLQMRLMTQRNTTWGIALDESDSILWPNNILALQNTLKRAIEDKGFYNRLQQESLNWLQEYASLENWKKSVRKLYEHCPTKHKIYNRTSDKVVINDECVTNQFLYGQKIIPFSNRLLCFLSHYWINHKIIKK